MTKEDLKIIFEEKRDIFNSENGARSQINKIVEKLNEIDIMHDRIISMCETTNVEVVDDSGVEFFQQEERNIGIGIFNLYLETYSMRLQNILNELEPTVIIGE